MSRILNPNTGRMIKADSPIGRLLRGYQRSCPSGKILNRKTGRCVKADGSIGRKIRAQRTRSRSPVRRSGGPCPRQDQVRNPFTNRCIKKTGSLARALGLRGSGSRNPCPPGKVRNLATGRCIKAKGPVAQRMRSLGPCPPGKIRNQSTGRCVSKDGAIGRKILGRPPKKQKRIKAKPWKSWNSESPMTHVYQQLPAVENDPALECAQVTAGFNLRRYQLLAIQHLLHYRSLLICFDVGLGKTITALVAAVCYLRSNPNGQVLILTTFTLLQNFIKELKHIPNGSMYGSRIVTKHYKQFVNDGRIPDEFKQCANRMVIIDEVHILRKGNVFAYNKIRACCAQADKIVLLTATPFFGDQNCMELCRYNNLLFPNSYVGEDCFQKLGRHTIVVTQNDLPSQMRANIPTANPIQDIMVQLTEATSQREVRALEQDGMEQQPGINAIAMEDSARSPDDAIDLDIGEPTNQRLDAFYHESRKVLNESPEKLAAFSDLLNQLEGQKTLVYARNYITLDKLEEKRDSVEVSGRAPNRQQIIDQFNAQPTGLMFISEAASFGVDLKGVINVIFYDVPWGPSELQQIVGRATRINAQPGVHDPRVNVFILICKMAEGFDDQPTADQIILKLLNEKRQHVDHCMEELRKMAIG